MRQVGTLANENDASRFAAYLVTQGITAHAEQDRDQWVIWVRDENDIPQALSSFESYRINPADPLYSGAEKRAESIRQQDYRRRVEASKNLVDMRGRWRQSGTRRGALTMTLVFLSVIVSVGTDFGHSKQGFGRGMQRQLFFCDPELYQLSGDPLASLKQGEVWRVVTPVFLHVGGWLHLIFNMLWLVQLGGQIEALRGTWRFGLLVLLTAAIPCLAQAVTPAWEGNPVLEALRGGAMFGGMSGVVYGLFGFVWMRSQFQPTSGFVMPQSTVFILIVWLILCMTGAVGNIANVAHLVGLIVGMTAGYLPTLWRR